MQYTKILFSPTGGTEKAANLLAEAMGNTWQELDLTSATTDYSQIGFTSDDVVLIAMPSFGGRIPPLAAERLCALSGGGAAAIVLCVYGNRAYEDTLIEMYDLAQKAGFCVAAGVAAVAEHSILHQYASGRPDATDKTTLTGFAAQIREKLDSGDRTAPKLPGNRPYKALGGGKMVPQANKSCTKCGACAASCPVAAIDAADPTKVDKNACIGCMRCVSICPVHARTVSKLMTTVAGLAIRKACTTRKECELYL